jgi:hypothetical protein
MRDVEARIYGALAWPLRHVVHVSVWQVVFHAAAVAEVYLVLRLLPGGDAVTFLDAFILETTGRLITVVFKFVPYRLGVDEAGAALVSRALLLDPTTGVTLAFVRRLRIVAWNAVGLVVLASNRR